MGLNVGLTKTSRQILVDLIGKSNGFQLQAGSLLFGTPVSLVESESDFNTKISVTTDERHVVLKGGNEFFYNRLPLEELVADDLPLQMPSSGTFRTMDGVLANVFKDARLGLRVVDFESQTLSGHGHTVPYNMPLTVSPNSLAYKGGTLDIGWALFDQLIASAGPKSARYDLRRSDAIFQDAVGTTPVTGSAQPLGRLVDLFGKGNHATQPTITARPSYWVDPATNEPVTWYDFTDDLLLWPGVAGAVGTIGVAYSLGAQVFDLTAPAHVPPGPMVELMFFDRTLTELECAVLQCYLELQVKDASWDGYVIGTGFEFTKPWDDNSGENAITRVTAGVYAEFSKDGRFYDTEWPDDGGSTKNLTLSSSRQRVRYGARDLTVPLSWLCDAWNSHTTWTADLSNEIYSRNPNATDVYCDGHQFGCLTLMRRGCAPPVKIYTVYAAGWPASSKYRLYGSKYTGRFVAPSYMREFYTWGVEYDPFEGGQFPDLNSVSNLTVLSAVPRTGYSYSGPFPSVELLAKLSRVSLGGMPFNGPLPVLPKVGFCSFTNCGLTNIDAIASMPELWVGYFNNNQLVGTIPNFNLPKLRRLDLFNNQLTGYAGGGIPDGDVGQLWLYFYNNLLTQAAVDLLILDCLNSGITTATVPSLRLHIHGTGNSAPSVQGKANAAILRTRGWSVNHNN